MPFLVVPHAITRSIFFKKIHHNSLQTSTKPPAIFWFTKYLYVPKLAVPVVDDVSRIQAHIKVISSLQCFTTILLVVRNVFVNLYEYELKWYLHYDNLL